MGRTSRRVLRKTDRRARPRRLDRGQRQVPTAVLVEVAPVVVMADAALQVVAHQVAAAVARAAVARAAEVVAALRVLTAAPRKAAAVRLRLVAMRVTRRKLWNVAQVFEKTTAAVGADEAEAGAVVGAEVALLDGAEVVARGRRRRRPTTASHPRPTRVRNPSHPPLRKAQACRRGHLLSPKPVLHPPPSRQRRAKQRQAKQRQAIRHRAKQQLLER